MRRACWSRGEAGLIVNISSFGAISHSFNLAYGLGKTVLSGMTCDTPIELRPAGVAVVSL